MTGASIQTEPPGNGNTLHYRMGEAERDIENLSRKVDRLIWSMFGLTLVVASSALGVAITILTTKGTG